MLEVRADFSNSVFDPRILAIKTLVTGAQLRIRRAIKVVSTTVQNGLSKEKCVRMPP